MLLTTLQESTYENSINHLPLQIMELLNDFIETAKAVKEEEAARVAIETSDDYMSLQSEIEQLQEQQKQLTAHLPDTREEYELDKKALIAHMIENNITDLEGCVVKIRNKKRVNTYEVLRSLDGDIDNLMLVASVTQAALTKFMKENDGFKHLKACIEDDGFTIADVLIAE